MKKKEIGRNRVKTFFLTLAAIGFVVGGIFMVKATDTSIFEKIIGGIGILFFGYGIPIGIKKLITNEVALELSDKCMIIEPKSNKKVVLLWDEIIGFDEIRIKGAKMIAINVSSPQNWIDKETNSIKRKMMQFNLNNYGTPFSITSTELNISHRKLLEKLNGFNKVKSL